MVQKILEPIEINGMRLKNRLALAPLLNMPRNDDCPDEKTVRWFEERAKGGLGLLMTGALIPVKPPFPLGMMGLYSDEHMEAFSKVVDAVHAHGAKIGVQLAMPGPLGGAAPSPGPYPDAENPTMSPLKIFMNFEAPTAELTVEQIRQAEDGFAEAAARTKRSGADCVELHCAHGGATLHCSFISPYYNRRTDEYGGSWENRLRFPVETLRKMREAVGDDFPILVRLSADQLLGDRGITLEDTTRHIVPTLEAAGVDCFDVSQGDIIRSPEGIQITLYYRRGCFIHLAEAVKKVTDRPVIGVGRIVDPAMAECFLQEGKADIIYMGRQFTSDTETLHKYLDGRRDEIRVCLACNEGCGTPCPVNYSISPDALPLTPAEKPKRVVVIGGGVAGMEAARICRLRGHRVTLFEKGAELGGMVAALALTPTTGELGNIVKYLGTQMRKLEVDVRVCKEAALADVEELAPDAVIVATGSRMQLPDLVQGKPWVMDHMEALRDMSAIGQRVVIWGLVATDLALYCSMNRRWHIFRKLTDIPFARAVPEAQRVDNPEVLFSTQVKEVRTDEIDVTDAAGKARTIPYDTLIVSLMRLPDDELFEQLGARGAEVYKIGDQLNLAPDVPETANIKGAIWSANEVARKI